MQLLVIAIMLFMLSGAVALATGRRAVGVYIGAAGAVAGCAVGLAGIALWMAGRESAELVLPWNSAWGASFSLGIDGLSAFFVAVIFILCAVAAVYGVRYTLAWQGKKNLGASWFFYNALAASMALVCLARNGILFLVAWEAMAIASYFLVMFEAEREEVRAAGWTYLVATHAGTAFILVMFVILAGGGGSFDFSKLGAAGGTATAAFVLALVGFGTKAGFMPLHVWLPEAHPVAPSHVSAVMSGVMIKTGIYGLLRAMTFLGPPQEWWGWTLVIIGAASGILGVLFALAQHDLKRLLAYHSVENIGIIALGLGIGVIGWYEHSLLVAVLGFGGGLLHVLNHALFKGLLFLGAGAVKHSTGTLEIDELGGLSKRMPQTAVFFFIGAAAISGLPPLNGFVSEFLIYLGSLHSLSQLSPAACAAGVAAIAGLALIGGLAAACFTKCFGIIFLGEPRSDHAARAHEAPASMRFAMGILAAACVGVGIAGPFVILAAAPVVADIMGVPGAVVGEGFAHASAALASVTIASGIFFALVGTLIFMRMRLAAGKAAAYGPTWDCGYVKPTARMQYTASSFAEPIVGTFRMFLRPRRQFAKPEGLFPRSAAHSTRTPDIFARRLFRPAFQAIAAAFARLRFLQEGRIQVYVLYIAITLLALLIWKLG